MQIYRIQCPNCNANLDVDEDEGLDFIFCKYCGYKCVIDYENMASQINYTKKLRSEERKLDKRYNHEERLIQLENEEKRKNDNQDTKSFFLTFLLPMFGLLAVCGISLLVMSIKEARKEKANIGNIKVESPTEYEGGNYQDVENLLKDMGFTNIECVELNEKAGLFKNAGDIKEIIIDGNSQFVDGDYFSKDAPVRLYYYSK